MPPSKAQSSGYFQWVSIHHSNIAPTGNDVYITNIKLNYGKFYDGNDMNKEVNISNNTPVKAGGSFRLSSCGRLGSPSGTEGSYDLVDKKTGKVIRHVYWDCPFGSSRNTFTITGGNNSWIVESTGGRLNSGALGVIFLTMVKLH